MEYVSTHHADPLVVLANMGYMHFKHQTNVGFHYKIGNPSIMPRVFEHVVDFRFEGERFHVERDGSYVERGDFWDTTVTYPALHHWPLFVAAVERMQRLRRRVVQRKKLPLLTAFVATQTRLCDDAVDEIIRLFIDGYFNGHIKTTDN